MTGVFAFLLLVSPMVAAFSTAPRHVGVNVETSPLSRKHQFPLQHRSAFMGNDVEETIQPTFDPMDFASKSDALPSGASVAKTVYSVATVVAPLTLAADKAVATAFSTGDLDPRNFSPVCPAADGVYRVLQGSTQAVVGEQNFVEYGPLIAGGLLRIRLELCVVESFFNEAVGPFIQKNGVSWILPLHETVETFLAGTIFSLASTFILVGSTKIVAVIITYFDVFFGAPARLFGNFFFDRARGKPVTLDVGFGPFKTRLVGPPQEEIEEEARSASDLNNFQNTNVLSLAVILLSGILKTGGDVLKILRDFFDLLDLFVGRYLVLIATGYILLKFVHFKVFPDFPPGF